MCEPVAVLHIELRHSRETIWRYNLTEDELEATVLAPWARGESVMLGDHFWRPDETTILILEGPELPPGMLTMGRGSINATRQGSDVTRDVLDRFRERYAASVEAATARGAAPTARGEAPTASGKPAGSGERASGAGVDQGMLADAFGLELLRELSDGPRSLHAVWLLCGKRHPQLEPSESLALARAAVASLLSSKLATVEAIGGEAAGATRVSKIEAWSHSGAAALQIRRA